MVMVTREVLKGGNPFGHGYVARMAGFCRKAQICKEELFGDITLHLIALLGAINFARGVECCQRQ